MAASNPVRFLQNLGAGDERALALKKFWGVVIETFREKTQFWDNSQNIVAFKDILAEGGKEWEFPVFGADPDPEYPAPGTEMLGMVVEMTAGSVTIDDILAAHLDIPIDQLILSHFDVMAPYARSLGRTVALKVDLNILITAIKAARFTQLLQSDASSVVHEGGNRVNATVTGDVETAYAASSTGATNFRNSAAHLAQLMDEDHVPEDGRNLFISPYIRRVLGFGTNIFSSDFNRTLPNDLNKRRIGILEGFDVFITTRLPSTNINTGIAKYQGDFRYNGGSVGNLTGWGETSGILNDGRPVAVALCGATEDTAAVGFVQAGGIVPHLEDDHRRNTKFLKAQIMCGCGVMAPWCAGEIYVDD